MPQIIRICKKFKLVECRNSRKIDRKSMNVPNREGVHKMYRQSRLVEKFDFVESKKIMKIQWKSMYVRCTDRMNLFKNLNLLNVQNHENSRKNSVHQMYRQYEFVEKFEFVECVKS